MSFSFLQERALNSPIGFLRPIDAGQMHVKVHRASDLQETLIEGRFLLPILGTGIFVRTRIWKRSAQRMIRFYLRYQRHAVPNCTAQKCTR
jgi:hypothetical protein